MASSTLMSLMTGTDDPPLDIAGIGRNVETEGDADPGIRPRFIDWVYGPTSVALTPPPQIETITDMGHRRTAFRTATSNEAPAPRLFGDEDGGWFLGTPDFVVTMERYTILNDAYDLQVTLRTKTYDPDLPDGGVWVRTFEFDGPATMVNGSTTSA